MKTPPSALLNPKMQVLLVEAFMVELGFTQMLIVLATKDAVTVASSSVPSKLKDLVLNPPPPPPPADLPEEVVTLPPKPKPRDMVELSH